MSTSPICKCFEQDCSVCYNYSIQYCPENTIVIPTNNLLKRHLYYIWIRDKLNNIYSSTWFPPFTVGTLDILTMDFPAGMFTPSFGPVTIFLTTDSSGEIIQPMIFSIGGNPYNCLILTVNEPVYLSDDKNCNLISSDIDNQILIAQ